MVEILRHSARAPRGVPRANGSRPVTDSELSNGSVPPAGAGLPNGPWLWSGAGFANGSGTGPARTRPRSQRLHRTPSALLWDALAVILALIAANQVMERGASIALPSDAGLTYPQLSVLLGAGWLAALAACRRSVRLPRGYWRTECRGIARAAFIVLGVVCMAAVVLPLDIARPFVAVTFTVGLLLQLTSRWFMRRAALHRLDDRARTAGPPPESRPRSTAVHE